MGTPAEKAPGDIVWAYTRLRPLVTHRIIEDWMGSPIETLADRIPEQPKAVCIGINPSPLSVAIGHYYQGRLGKQFLARLRQAGLLPESIDCWEDDAGYAEGVGFTDVVKRATRRATDVRREELEHGRELLTAKLAQVGAPLVIFTFKAGAVALFGRFKGNGFSPRIRLGPSEVFVMPGPMEPRSTADETIEELRAHLRAK